MEVIPWPFLVPISLFVCGAAAAILRGPVGKALAERISGGGGEGAAREVEALRAELEDLRHRLVEVEERMDFAERVLARQREYDRLGPGA